MSRLIRVPWFSLPLTKNFSNYLSFPWKNNDIKFLIISLNCQQWCNKQEISIIDKLIKIKISNWTSRKKIQQKTPINGTMYLFGLAAHSRLSRNSGWCGRGCGGWGRGCSCGGCSGGCRGGCSGGWHFHNHWELLGPLGSGTPYAAPITWESSTFK